jgi:hypothetical protein
MLEPVRGRGRRVQLGCHPTPQCPTVVVLNPRSGDVALANRAALLEPQRMVGVPPELDPSSSSTPLNPPGGSTPKGSPSRHTLPSPPPPSPPAPLGASQWHRDLKCVSCHALEMDAAKEQLWNSLVTFVCGARLLASPAQVASHLLHHFEVTAEEVRVCRYGAGSFLLCFRYGPTADRVLHAPWPSSVGLTLIFSCYTRQASALFSPLQFKFLIAIGNLPVHTWSINTAQEVLGSSALTFDVAPVSADGSDLSQFLVATWARHPDLIPNEVGGVVPEPVEPFIDRVLPLFVSSSELVNSTYDTLQFRVFILVLEVHDYTRRPLQFQ